MVGSWSQLNPQASRNLPGLLQFLDIAFQGGDACLQGRDRGGEFPQLDEGLADAKRCQAMPWGKLFQIFRLETGDWRCGAGEVFYPV